MKPPDILIPTSEGESRLFTPPSIEENAYKSPTLATGIVASRSLLPLSYQHYLAHPSSR